MKKLFISIISALAILSVLFFHVERKYKIFKITKTHPLALNKSDENFIKNYILKFPFRKYGKYEYKFKLSSKKFKFKFYIDNPNDYIKRFIVKNQMYEPHISEKMIKYIKKDSTTLDI